MNFEKTTELKDVLNKKHQLTGLKESIEEQRKNILSNTNGNVDIDSILEKYTEDEIKNMSFETMKETFVDNDGNFIFNEKELSKDLIMDFIKYLKLSKVTYDKMDKEFEKLDTYLEEFNSEIENLTDKTSFNKMLKNNIEDALNQEGVSPEAKEKYKRILTSLEDASTLRPLFELYETISVKNTLRELKDEQRRIATLKQYVNICKKYKIEPHLLKFGDFEKIFEEEKYQEHKNLFVFIVARYVKYLDNKMADPIYRSFVVQLVNYMREIIMGEDNEFYQADKDEIEILKGNIKLLLDKFYN